MARRYAVRTVARPAGEGWREVPSVTYGGAPTFWYRRDPATGRNEWISYDRIMRAWYRIAEGRVPREDRREMYAEGGK